MCRLGLRGENGSQHVVLVAEVPMDQAEVHAGVGRDVAQRCARPRRGEVPRRRVDELTDRENEALLPMLCDHIRSPDFQCRFAWQPGSVAFWDNRCTQHHAVADYTEPRVMHSVVIDGTVPLSTIS